MKHHFVHRLIVCSDDDRIWNVRRRFAADLLIQAYILLLILSCSSSLCISYAFILFIHSIVLYIPFDTYLLSLSLQQSLFLLLTTIICSVDVFAHCIPNPRIYERISVCLYVRIYVYAYPVGFCTCSMLALVYYSKLHLTWFCVRVRVCVRVHVCMCA